MNETQNSKPFDLEERTFKFAKTINGYVKMLSRTIVNVEISKQLVRSGGSVGANYIEANESLGRKDFIMRIKICRKEAKETIYWLKLSEPQSEGETEKNLLIKEATELMKIFGSIVEKCT
jgi:four helix bundle protein